VGCGREDAHVQAGLGDDRAGERRADAGDLREPLCCRQGGGVRAAAGARAGLAGGVGAPGGGDGVQGGLDLVLDRGDGPVEQGDVVQVDADQRAVVVPDLHSLQGPGDRAAPALDAPGGQPGQGPRVALAAGDGLHDDPGRLGPGQRVHHGRQLDQGSFQQLLQPLPLPGAVADQLQPAAGQVPQRPDLRRRHERRPQQPHLGQPGDPLRVQPVGLRPPGQLPGMAGVHQLYPQPGPLQQVKPDPPVIAGRLHDGQLHTIREQPAGQRQDLPRRRGNLLHPRRPPPARTGRRQPDAHVRLRLRDIDPRHPLMPELVVLILHQLRGNLPLPRVTHRGPPILDSGTQGGLPGDPGQLA